LQNDNNPPFDLSIGNKMKKFKNLSRNIFIALIFGALVGWLFPASAAYVSFLGLSFRLSLSMIVMPIIITSIFLGMESLGDISKLSGFGIKTILYFLSTSVIAIVIGLSIVTLVEPGVRKPSQKIKNIILNIKAADEISLIKSITHAVGHELSYEPTSQHYMDLENSLFRLANNGANQDSIRHGALRLIGSLELRANLEKEEKPKSTSAITIGDFFIAQIKKSFINPFEALAQKNVLAVIIFALLFGGAMTTIGPAGKKFFELNQAANLALIKIVELIMLFAPFGVFGLIVEIVASTGPGVFSKLGLYAFCVLSGLLIHILVILPTINYFFAKISPKVFFKALRPAMVIAFSTSSSSATLPITMQCVENNLGVKKRISRFVLPLGATLNMDGTALYEAVAAVFIAQLYGISLNFQSQIMIAITAALASIGAAGIPAAGTVTMAMVLSAVGLPIEGIGLLLAIDRPLDMCRTAINVAGDATGCMVLSRYAPEKFELNPDEKFLDQKINLPTGS
jgi:Na+/H+-dicarboxylate symporter